MFYLQMCDRFRNMVSDEAGEYRFEVDIYKVPPSPSHPFRRRCLINAWIPCHQLAARVGMLPAALKSAAATPQEFVPPEQEEDTLLPVSVTDRGAGQLEVRYSAEQAGSYIVEIRLNGKVLPELERRLVFVPTGTDTGKCEVRPSSAPRRCPSACLCLPAAPLDDTAHSSRASLAVPLEGCSAAG